MVRIAAGDSSLPGVFKLLDAGEQVFIEMPDGCLIEARLLEPDDSSGTPAEPELRSGSASD